MKRLLIAIVLSAMAAGCSGRAAVLPSAPNAPSAERSPAVSYMRFSLVGGLPKSGPAHHVRSLTILPYNSNGKPRAWTLNKALCLPTHPCSMKVPLGGNPSGALVYLVRSYDNTGGKGRLLSTTVVLSTPAYGPNPIGLTLIPSVEQAGVAATDVTPAFGKSEQILLSGVARDRSGNVIIGPAPYDHVVGLRVQGSMNITTTKVTSAVHPVALTYDGGFQSASISIASKITAPFGVAASEVIRPMLSSSERTTLLGSSGGSASSTLVEASDGSVWMSAFNACSAVKINSDLSTQPFPVPSTIACPNELANGPDGNMWFTAGGAPFGNGGSAGIGKVTPAGAITGYPIPSSGTELGPIASGPDGKLWMVDVSTGDIYNATTSGQFTTASYSLKMPYGQGIVTGPDGNLWITDAYGSNYGFYKVSTAGALVGHYSVHGPGAMFVHGGYVYALLGSTGTTQSVGQWNGNGQLVKTYTPIDKYMTLSQIALGPDGAIWFGLHAGASNGGLIDIGRISSTGSYSEVVIPYATLDNSTISGLVAGGDGRLYYTRGDYLGAITVPSGT